MEREKWKEAEEQEEGGRKRGRTRLRTKRACLRPAHIQTPHWTGTGLKLDLVLIIISALLIRRILLIILVIVVATPSKVR